MSDADRSYFQARAEQELRMAEDAQDICAARAHSLLAGLYLDRVHGEPAKACRKPGL